MYVERFYRTWMHSTGLVTFRVKQAQSDLFIACERELSELAAIELESARAELCAYLRLDPAFGSALKPHAPTPDAPPLVQHMANSCVPWRVGPMATVAGAIAQRVGRRLLQETDTVLIENGGDCFARLDRPLQLAVFAGDGSPFNGNPVFEVDARDGLGICTSSGVVGPSLSFGRADAVVAIHPDAAVADAAATALANEVETEQDIERVMAAVPDTDLTGAIACKSNTIGLWGDLTLVDPEPTREYEREKPAPGHR